MLFRRPGDPRRRWKVLLVQALILLLIYIGLRTWMQRDMVSGPVPEFTAHLISGEVFSPRDYAGKTWLLHFWAEWCPICRAEQGAITSVMSRWPVITVAMQSGDRIAVEDYLREHGLEWPTVLDQSGSLAKRFGVDAVPSSFVIDANGQIRFRETGYTTSWGLRFRLWLADLMD